LPNSQANERIVTVNQTDGSSAHVDPVCGLEIQLFEEDVEHTDLNGRVYWFCSLRCRGLFEADVSRFVSLRYGSVTVFDSEPLSGCSARNLLGYPPTRFRLQFRRAHFARSWS